MHHNIVFGCDLWANTLDRVIWRSEYANIAGSVCRNCSLLNYTRNTCVWTFLFLDKNGSLRRKYAMWVGQWTSILLHLRWRNSLIKEFAQSPWWLPLVRCISSTFHSLELLIDVTNDYGTLPRNDELMFPKAWGNCQLSKWLSVEHCWHCQYEIESPNKYYQLYKDTEIC